MTQDRRSGPLQYPAGPDQGFTLTELMVVVLILALLLLIAIASYVPATRAAAAASCRQNQKVMEQALVMALTSSDAAPPTTLEDLRPYAANFDSIATCPRDGTPLVLDVATNEVICPNHP